MQVVYKSNKPRPSSSTTLIAAEKSTNEGLQQGKLWTGCYSKIMHYEILGRTSHKFVKFKKNTLTLMILHRSSPVHYFDKTILPRSCCQGNRRRHFTTKQTNQCTLFSRKYMFQNTSTSVNFQSCSQFVFLGRHDEM